jgi:predicted acylesterase/phospholipase RssA
VSRVMGKGRGAVIGALAVLVLAGCVAVVPRESFTAQQVGAAEVPGFANVRYWADAATPALARMVDQRLREARQNRGRGIDWLMLSGGGEDGAFGAGVLYGMTEAGRRPKFSLVSGVSTGALIAPFAFLGPAYDEQLRETYTTINKDDIARPHVLAGLLGGDSLADASPLEQHVARYATPDLLEAVAREHRAGRRLFVVTTNLDAQRPVMWDMGAIAARGDPQGLALFRKVLLASASIPGLLPPVMIESTVDGRAISEMHVDGGTTMQVLTIPMGLDLERRARAAAPAADRHLYIVMNNRMRPEFQLVSRSTLPIARRSVSTLTKSSGLAALRLYRDFAERARMGFHVAFIDQDFARTAPAPFDRDYMNALFEYGRERARAGDVWQAEVPRSTAQ